MTSARKRKAREPSNAEPFVLPTLEEYAKQFRAKFDREMLPEEKRFYNLTREMMAHPPDDDDAA